LTQIQTSTSTHNPDYKLEFDQDTLTFTVTIIHSPYPETFESDLDLDFDLEHDLNIDLILTWTLDADFRTSECTYVTSAIYRILFYDTLDVRTAVLRIEQPSLYTVDVNTLGEVFFKR